MSVYGASFIREVGESGQAFAETARVIRERNQRWLEASPDHLTIRHTLRSHPGTPWISVENALDNELLEQVVIEESTARWKTFRKQNARPWWKLW